MAFETIPQLVLGNGRKFRSAPAYFVRGEGGWEATSWSDYAAEVRRACAALVALGVEPGQAVCILGANRPEWVIADFATLAIGAVDVPLYPTLTGEQSAHILRESGARVIFVSTAGQLKKIQAVQAAAKRRAFAARTVAFTQLALVARPESRVRGCLADAPNSAK